MVGSRVQKTLKSLAGRGCIVHIEPTSEQFKKVNNMVIIAERGKVLNFSQIQNVVFMDVTRVGRYLTKL